MKPFTTSLVALSSLSSLSRAYTWPDPLYDQLEELYVTSSGFGTGGFYGGVEPCDFAPSNNRSSGRQAAAEWVRTAYHDMATADVAAGTGGIDASIAFETDRAENVGDAFNSSFNFFVGFQNKYVSMSDLIALGSVVAVKQCSGPSIPLRAGRIDATSAGVAGVPEPQQDLASHTASFAKQGFNQTDMIALVACGHTLGGVHEEDFPTIVRNQTTEDDNSSGMQHFDDSFEEFDNHIAVQWVNSSTSTNALATGFNETTNSDARIFAADGNATMRTLASDNTVFANKCSEVLARMIDTVPSGVKLGDVVQPIPVKPYRPSLSITPSGQIKLEGYVRIFTSKDNDASPDEYDVNITWTDRTGASCDACTASATWPRLFASSPFGIPNYFYYNTTIDPTAGFSAFKVHYKESSDRPVTTGDNGGNGFPLTDTVMWQQEASCVKDQKTVTIVASVRTLFAGFFSSLISVCRGQVRNDQNITSAYIDYTSPQAQLGAVSRKMVPGSANLTKTGPSGSSLYDLYTANFDVEFTDGSSVDFVVEAGGKIYRNDFNLINGIQDC
ncbi:heme peroxidase [Amylostereum chailletii]|nr:heme peroxidase [Amylostereum chailletii]